MTAAAPEDVYTLLRAADEVASSDPKLAGRWLEAAMQRVEPHPDDGLRVQLLPRLIRALGLSGRMDESRALLPEALSLIPAEQHHGLRASTVAFCALMECFLGRYAQARNRIAAELVAMPTDPPAEMVALFIADSYAATLSGDQPDRTGLQAALRIAMQQSDRLAQAGVFALLALSDNAGGDLSAARVTLSRAAEAMDGLSDDVLARYPEYIAILGATETTIGELASAQRHFLRGLNLVRRTGHGYIVPMLLVGRGHVCHRSGSLEQARGLAAEAAVLAGIAGAPHMHQAALELESLCESSLQSDRWTLLAEQAASQLPAIAGTWSLRGDLALAVAAMANGEPGRCVNLVLEAAGGPDLLLLAPMHRPVLQELLCRAALRLDDVEAATFWAAAARQSALSDGLSIVRAYAAAAEAHVATATGRHALAACGYERAAEHLGDAGARAEQASVLLAVAERAAAGGTDNSAASMMAMAKELARTAGAIRVYEMAAAAELRLSEKPVGVRQNATAEAGEARPLVEQWTSEDEVARHRFSSLTVRERQVALIVGTGKRSREIAQELCVSPRTVDLHLTRIYRKLDIKSRAELVRLIIINGG